ncbi:hypothetical protein HK101_002585 [Irineochytrium annulatum]|nr:hypothetical protein HK101_002585 [Irineochytrium annulatum]
MPSPTPKRPVQPQPDVVVVAPDGGVGGEVGAPETRLSRKEKSNQLLRSAAARRGHQSAASSGTGGAETGRAVKITVEDASNGRPVAPSSDEDAPEQGGCEGGASVAGVSVSGSLYAKQACGRRSVNQMPSVRENAGRRIVLDPWCVAGKEETYNFDPMVSSNRVLITGAMRTIVAPAIWLYRSMARVLVVMVFGSDKGKFVDNTVRTAKYTMLDFLPKQIIMQFSKLANMYFIFISLLQLVPGWSPTGQYTTIFPLAVFVGLAMLKEGWEDYNRHKQDALENESVAKKLKVLMDRGSASSINHSKAAFAESDGVRVGDVLLVEQGEVIPADLVVLGSSLPNGSCFIETSNLDGESNLKQKQALAITQGLLVDILSFTSFSAKIHAESASGNLFRFEGNIDIATGNRGKHTLTVNQFIPRGTTLANTDYIYGVATYTGEETKIRMNATKFVKTKSPNVEHITNKIVVGMFFFLFIISSFSTLFSVTWELSRFTENEFHWYLGAAYHDRFGTFFSFMILYNTLIPISLYVVMEFVKVVQMFHIGNDIHMYDEVSDTPAQARTSNLHEELGQVQYLFSDKTGTLTQNVMMFKKLSVGGRSFSHGVSQDSASASAATAATRGLGSRDVMTMMSPEVPSDVLVREILTHTSSAHSPDLEPGLQLAVEFLLAIALCHTVTLDRKSPLRAPTMVHHPSLRSRAAAMTGANANRGSAGTGGSGLMPVIIPPEDLAIVYQSSSPDEIALVQAAREMTFTVRGRTMTTITLNTLLSARESTYEILHTIEFSSARKRMSVIYRYPDGRIVIICKGADSVILERLRDPAVLKPRELIDLERTIQHLADFATEGLRTLLYASRELDEEEYKEWAERYHAASLALANRTELMEEIAEEVECDLVLLGATAIEDKLQVGVPDTIDKLRRAGIKVWMLTGDKRETAINIAYTCQLAREWSDVILVDGANVSALEASITSAMEKCVASKSMPRIERHPNNHGNQLEKNVLMFLNEKLGRSATKPHIIIVIDGDALAKIEAQHAELTRTSTESTRGMRSPRVVGSESLLNRFLELGIICDGVICCRFSPAQKALLVTKVRERIGNIFAIASTQRDPAGHPAQPRAGRLDWWMFIKHFFLIGRRDAGVTMAIGDGANDIPMLQAAHVGIGITGREGLAASRASDYVVAQFRFLQPLLFVHGRWCYIRVCLFTLGTFYKCVTFYLTQMLFQIFTGWSGTSLYEQWTLTLYNILFSSLPVIVVGIFEKDLNKSTLLSVPELYQYGQLNCGLNLATFLRWMGSGVWHAMVAVLIPALMYNGFVIGPNLNLWGMSVHHNLTTINYGKYTLGDITASDASAINQETSLYPLGTVSYTIVVLLVNLKVCYVSSHNWTALTHASFVASIGLWWAFVYIYSFIWPKLGSLGADTNGMARALNALQPRIWLAQLIAAVVAFGAWDAVTHPGLWRFGAMVADVVAMAARGPFGVGRAEEGLYETSDKSHEKSYDKITDLARSKSVRQPHQQPQPGAPPSSRSSNNSRVTTSNFMAAGAAANDFATRLMAAAATHSLDDAAPDSDGAGPCGRRRRRPAHPLTGHASSRGDANRGEVDWGGVVPIWQLWEREVGLTSDQDCGKGEFSPQLLSPSGHPSLSRCKSFSPPPGLGGSPGVGGNGGSGAISPGGAMPAMPPSMCGSLRDLGTLGRSGSAHSIASRLYSTNVPSMSRVGTVRKQASSSQQGSPRNSITSRQASLGPGSKYGGSGSDGIILDELEEFAAVRRAGGRAEGGSLMGKSLASLPGRQAAAAPPSPTVPPQLKATLSGTLTGTKPATSSVLRRANTTHGHPTSRHVQPVILETAGGEEAVNGSTSL